MKVSLRSCRSNPPAALVLLLLVQSLLLLPLGVALPSRFAEAATPAAAPGPDRHAYFGDLHVHTQNSFDAVTYGVRATPDDAYRYAKGEALIHALGYPIRLESGPLDFLAVSDHAEYIGVMPALADPASPLARQPALQDMAKQVQSTDSNERLGVFGLFVSYMLTGEAVPGLDIDSPVTRSGWQQRVQIIKGWIEDGASTEQVFDVACSDGLEPDPKTNRCPDNGATVNLEDCSPSLDKGAVELASVWSDPTFDPAQFAFYYARVLQNPTCRWSTWDAIRAGVEPSQKVPATIQERAWSSPIWYAPPNARIAP